MTCCGLLRADQDLGDSRGGTDGREPAACEGDQQPQEARLLSRVAPQCRKHPGHRFR